MPPVGSVSLISARRPRPPFSATRPKPCQPSGEHDRARVHAGLRFGSLLPGLPAAAPPPARLAGTAAPTSQAIRASRLQCAGATASGLVRLLEKLSPAISRQCEIQHRLKTSFSGPTASSHTRSIRDLTKRGDGASGLRSTNGAPGLSSLGSSERPDRTMSASCQQRQPDPETVSAEPLWEAGAGSDSSGFLTPMAAASAQRSMTRDMP